MAGIDDELGQIKLKIAFTERQFDELRPGQYVEVILTDTAKQEIKQLLTTQQQELLDRVMGALPKEDDHKHVTRDYCLDCQKRDGYNQALSDVVSAIKKIREEL